MWIGWWAALSQAAPEVCDGVDQDGDGGIDEVPVVWYADADEDGYGDPAVVLAADSCLGVPGYVSNADDCDDDDVLVFPGGVEGNVPNAEDDDCDGVVDDLTNPPANVTVARRLGSTYLVDDTDRDWTGSSDRCVGFGYDLTVVQDSGENDFLAGLIVDYQFTFWWIGLNEDPDLVWVDGTVPGFENFANGQPEEGQENCIAVDVFDAQWYDQYCTDFHPAFCEVECVASPSYADLDGDGLGDPLDAQDECALSPTRVRNAADCDDADAAEGVRLWYTDVDDDGIGAGDAIGACDAPEGTAPLLLANGGVVRDCDDGNPFVSPGAPELCDELDNDCDLAVDEEVQTLPWYPDADGDGFGVDVATPVVDCASPGEGYVLDAGDCDDGDEDVFPGATDVPGDDVDQDCDGLDTPADPSDPPDGGAFDGAPAPGSVLRPAPVGGCTSAEGAAAPWTALALMAWLAGRSRRASRTTRGAAPPGR